MTFPLGLVIDWALAVMTDSNIANVVVKNIRLFMIRGI